MQSVVGSIRDGARTVVANGVGVVLWAVARTVEYVRTADCPRGIEGFEPGLHRTRELMKRTITESSWALRERIIGKLPESFERFEGSAKQEYLRWDFIKIDCRVAGMVFMLMGLRVSMMSIADLPKGLFVGGLVGLQIACLIGNALAMKEQANIKQRDEEARMAWL